MKFFSFFRLKKAVLYLLSVFYLACIMYVCSSSSSGRLITPGGHVANKATICHFSSSDVFPKNPYNVQSLHLRQQTFPSLYV